MESFDGKLTDVKTKCCANGNCDTGVPANCNFNCSRSFPGFFKDCRSLVESQDRDNFFGYQQLSQTCTRLPTAAMLTAIVGAKCPVATHKLAPTGTSLAFKINGYASFSVSQTALFAHVDIIEKMFDALTVHLVGEPA